jgi:hypothetical protein
MRKAAVAIIRETLGDKNARYYMALQVGNHCSAFSGSRDGGIL